MCIRTSNCKVLALSISKKFFMLHTKPKHKYSSHSIERDQVILATLAMFRIYVADCAISFFLATWP